MEGRKREERQPKRGKGKKRVMRRDFLEIQRFIERVTLEQALLIGVVVIRKGKKKREAPTLAKHYRQQRLHKKVWWVPRNRRRGHQRKADKAAAN